MSLSRNPIARAVTACLTAVIVALLARPVPAASPCEWTGIERVVAVGDVQPDRFVGSQGRRRHRRQLQWAGGTAHVVQLGDIVDRGDDSQALDLVQRLEKESHGQLHRCRQPRAARMLGDLRLTAAGESPRSPRLTRSRSATRCSPRSSRPPRTSARN
jgi:hypothetical protein